VHPDYPSGGSYFSWRTFNHIEHMEDVSRPQDRLTNVGSWVNACRHEKWTYHGKVYQDWSGDYGLNHHPVLIGPLLETDVLQSMLPTLPVGDRNDLLLEAFNAFTEVWPEEISAAETTQGLLDLKSMIPKFSGNIVSDLAALHLNKTFAWDSLVSDFRSLGSLASSVEKRLVFLRKTYGKPVPLRFRRDNILQANLGSEVVLEPVRGWGVKYILRGYRLGFHATATLRQLMSHLDDAIGYLRGFVGAIGGANPLKQAWNLVPLSFVVDYFFNISGRLDALARLRPEEPWELSRVTHSFREAAVWDIWQTNPHIIDGPQTPDQYLGTVVKTNYERALGLPWTASMFDLSSLNPGQLGLLSALAAGIKYR
jgi:hypothetical protein